MGNVEQARAQLANAEHTMELAMVDGFNVHGAIGDLIAATEIYNDARLNDQGTLEASVQRLLDSYPDAIRVREGGGPEDLIASLSATFILMQEKLK